MKCSNILNEVYLYQYSMSAHTHTHTQTHTHTLKIPSIMHVTIMQSVQLCRIKCPNDSHFLQASAVKLEVTIISFVFFKVFSRNKQHGFHCHLIFLSVNCLYIGELSPIWPVNCLQNICRRTVLSVPLE